MKVTTARWMIVAFVLAGLAGASGLLLAFRTPCGGLLRRYTAAYAGARTCQLDADCVLDPMPPAGPGLCDRARAASADRAPLADLERAWAEAACPAPASACAAVVGVRCEQGRCASLLR
jgi:hypothetical protein